MTEAFDTSIFPILSVLSLGFLLGLRHAFDPDHLAAVSTLVTEHPSPWRSTLVGVSWGLGHTLALLAFGGAVVAFRIVLSPELTGYLELAVAAVLIFLGANVLSDLWPDLWKRRPVLHLHRHEHDGVLHTHLHVHRRSEEHTAQHQHRHHLLRLGRKPFLVGIVHGMGGTAALVLLVVGVIPSALLAVFYILIFGLGSIGGMVLISALMSLPLALAGKRIRSAERVLRFSAGCFSIAFGLFLVWRAGIFE
ncbi:MAG: hypothetical protein O6850_07395 [Acidobacteria bacterium]|nr:hypothetical protein [Acidobacteriota bacterium]